MNSDFAGDGFADGGLDAFQKSPPDPFKRLGTGGAGNFQRRLFDFLPVQMRGGVNGPQGFVYIFIHGCGLVQPVSSLSSQPFYQAEFGAFRFLRTDPLWLLAKIVMERQA